jgi:hypothetical protein
MYTQKNHKHLQILVMIDFHKKLQAMRNQQWMNKKNVFLECLGLYNSKALWRTSSLQTLLSFNAITSWWLLQN